MIKIEGLNFNYDKTPIIKDMNLMVESNNFLGILGPNGSGKTTLIKIISGLLRDFQGKISILNKNILDYSEYGLAQTISVVPQDTIIPFNFTAFEVVLMGRAPFLSRLSFESKADTDLAEYWMKRTYTWEFRDRPINELSAGERQRVIIARALTQTPKILLLDEPTSAMDIKHQMEIMTLLSSLNIEHHLTIVAVLHDINLAAAFCKNICLMKAGRVIDIGPTKDLITYKNIKAIFETEVYVGLNDLTRLPYYVPISPPR